MKKFFLAIFSFLPVLSMAQSNWEVPTEQKDNQKGKELVAKLKNNDSENLPDVKYLKGAVPEIDGKVVFSFEQDVPGKTAQQLYEAAYQFLDTLTRGDLQYIADMKDGPQRISRISIVNRNENTIVAVFDEWLTFTSNFINLDRTRFKYAFIVKCTDGHVYATIDRICYLYEEGRTTELTVKAENWINDKNALNKKGDKLNRSTAKFRRKTVDRVQQIFKDFKLALL